MYPSQITALGVLQCYTHARHTGWMQSSNQHQSITSNTSTCTAAYKLTGNHNPLISASCFHHVFLSTQPTPSYQSHQDQHPVKYWTFLPFTQNQVLPHTVQPLLTTDGRPSTTLTPMPPVPAAHSGSTPPPSAAAMLTLLSHCDKTIKG